MEHGVVNDGVPMMAKNIQGIFSVEAKRKKLVMPRLPRIARRRQEVRVYLLGLLRTRRNPRRR